MKNIGLIVIVTVMFSHQGMASSPHRNVAKQGEKEEKLNSPQKQVSSNVNRFDNKKRRHGYWEFYWDDENTKVVCKGRFRHGKQIDKWSYFTQEGTLEKVEKNKLFGKTIKTTMYYPSGQVWKKGVAKVTFDEEYVNYFWVGKWKVYKENGEFDKIEEYKDGSLVGAAEEFFELEN